MPVLTPDPDPTDANRACDLSGAGLHGYCATVVINASGEEVFMLARYGQGDGAGYVTDWARIAPHEIPLDTLPIYTLE